MKDEAVLKHLALIGAKGGKTKGPTKLRGNRQYYVDLGLLAGKTHAAKKAARLLFGGAK